MQEVFPKTKTYHSNMRTSKGHDIPSLENIIMHTDIHNFSVYLTKLGAINFIHIC